VVLLLGSLLLDERGVVGRRRRGGGGVSGRVDLCGARVRVCVLRASDTKNAHARAG
jgi:hypothetical protein